MSPVRLCFLLSSGTALVGCHSPRSADEVCKAGGEVATTWADTVPSPGRSRFAIACSQYGAGPGTAWAGTFVYMKEANHSPAEVVEFNHQTHVGVQWLDPTRLEVTYGPGEGGGVTFQAHESLGVTVLLRQASTNDAGASLPSDVTPDSSLLAAIPPESPLLRELRAKGRLLSGDTIFVYSAEWDSSWEFAGDSLATRDYALIEPLLSGSIPSTIYVAGRLALDSGTEGFLLRVPSQYSSTGIQLWTYDHTTKMLRPVARLADNFGDEGYITDLSSWLMRRDHRWGLAQLRENTNHDLETGKLKFEVDTLWIGSLDSLGRLAVVPESDSALWRPFTMVDWRRRAHRQ